LKKAEKIIVLGQNVKWKPSEENTYKLNVDGSLLQVAGRGGWGYVARDHGLASLMVEQVIFSELSRPCKLNLSRHWMASLGMSIVILESGSRCCKGKLMIN
jgi:hypothetical protein